MTLSGLQMKALLSILLLLGKAIAQNSCDILSPDVQLSARLCFGTTCLDETDFANIKVITIQGRSNDR
jgi:hypothetical protein